MECDEPYSLGNSGLQSFQAARAKALPRKQRPRISLALYAPGLGYYQAGSAKLGSAGDFVTAPELTPLFARALARQVAQFGAAGIDDILELGAGSGRLAADLADPEKAQAAIRWKLGFLRHR